MIILDEQTSVGDEDESHGKLGAEDESHRNLVLKMNLTETWC